MKKDRKDIDELKGGVQYTQYVTPSSEKAEPKDYAICHIHGKFYAGFPECPTCKEMKEADKSESEVER